MAKILLLPPDIISKIAAGEVIERPASVVKELMENSLDAGATSIELTLKDAGRTLIRLKDNGSGIGPDDIEHVFLRHATSKINSINDLYRINTLGFRGEALYSIAAISDVTVRSKATGEANGWEIHVRGNERISLKPINLQQGTDIEIRELFFNTPARRKFLRSDTTELKQILNVFLPYTLLYPQNRFLLTHNEKVLFELHPEKSAVARVSLALHLPEKYLIEAQRDFPNERTSLRLILGDINIPRINKESQYIFINDRPVQSKFISFHLNQIYRILFTSHVHPFFAVYIHLPAENLDVNVHPAKREVKVKDEHALISLLRGFCERTLMTAGNPKGVNSLEKLNKQGSGALLSTNPGPLLQTCLNNNLPQQYILSQQNNELVFAEKTLSALPEAHLLEKLSVARFIGTFLKTYCLFEAAKTLIIIDQHAAFERITYERLLQQIDSGALEIQNLLTPLLITLTPQEMLTWEELKTTIEKLGFSVTRWDRENIAIHSHPQLINYPETAFRTILSGEKTEHYDVDIVARRACRQSVMAGHEMNKEEAAYLQKQLLACKDPFICPHGRPTTIEIPQEILVKQFLRK
ncbi:MAG: DNA mismatch repair endonuclease MutL [Candidatus Omnitrophota bacterium]|jgi:DNA mismatch repair protein MutL